ncbi:ribosomal-processing cysteine protease Prp [Paenibacillus sp. NPDC056579]|uniref:ribosomal-processing cysteine protease Prp n=1 Tax=Paenibacillus sp. NPDC056579 TaxID=3345871 RepID=UPI00369A7311
MIRATIKRRPDGRIESFRVKGHALYGDPGKDIVCAGVSAVTVGTVNAVEAVLGLELKANMKHGLLEVEVPGQLDEALSEKVQLILESMVVMLQSIQQSYGAYIALKETH